MKIFVIYQVFHDIKIIEVQIVGSSSWGKTYEVLEIQILENKSKIL